MTSGAAFQMRWRLHALMREHHVECDPVSIPLTEPTAHPMVVEGYASDTSLDLDRVRLRRYAFGYPLPYFRRDYPPLCVKHNTEQRAGKIESLEYDDKGSLKIRATVTHPQARRMGAFSIAAKVIDYEMRDADSENFYAVINSAELTEISLTDRPANPRALVTHRYPASAKVQFLDNMQQKVQCLTKLTTLIKETHNGSRS